ncbi:MAG: hypothetical protein IKP26_03930 [Clostridia bacterium]|nr:hypothetical protein [Clostridia bacterium]
MKTEEVKEILDRGGAEAAGALLGRFPITAAAVIGLDKKPKAHAVEFCFEQDGALYFAAAKCETFYGELSLRPDFSLIACDPESGACLRLQARAEFTEDKDIIARIAGSGCGLAKKYGDPNMLIAFFPVGITAEAELAGETVRLELVPASALVGITLKKNSELRDRISKLIERRADGAPAECGEDPGRIKLYDGALTYFAEKAKELWPRMNVMPLEAALCFETYDERERYVLLAKKLIGNREISKPEDLTYYINIETLEELNG